MDNKGRILVADDQEGIRKLLTEICSIMDYDIETVSSGEKAIELIKDNMFDVFLVDMKMPGMTGIETIEKAKVLRPKIKSILMTGYGENYLLEDLLEKGFCGVIQKPFDINDLMDMLDNLIGQPQVQAK